ncbi:GSCFA domain-containing protein [Celeribacter arenosi]|uniref:GSCFA domain-containing protein n=1 Tax=Celeribacter arenosi TaxID=792649 RepID=A0ABP7KHB3_9RHOB
MSAHHPYADLPDSRFWRAGVVEADRLAWHDLYCPKFPVTAQTEIATAGSCFAQHIGRALAGAGVVPLNGEPAPASMHPQTAERFQYGLYSARYGNIYTARQFRELLDDAATGHVDDRLIWRARRRFFDALRPSVEPDGWISQAEVMAMRRDHLMRVQAVAESADVFVFTLGLTEAWIDTATGRTVPTAPGVIAGRYKPAQVRFHNYSYDEIMEDLAGIRDALQVARAGSKLLLTVSPVPLTATASGAHVLAATQLSKAILRAAAGDFADAHDDVDYFPSYEIVTTHASGEMAFAQNRRSVRPEMVARVMDVFLRAHGLEPSEQGPKPSFDASEPQDADEEDALVCEEALLDAMRE